jgi:hypothetical protein
MVAMAEGNAGPVEEADGAGMCPVGGVPGRDCARRAVYRAGVCRAGVVRAGVCPVAACRAGVYWAGVPSGRAELWRQRRRTGGGRGAVDILCR